MTGPHPSTKALITRILSAIESKGTMTFDELRKALGVSKGRLRSALGWALRTDVKQIGERRYRVSR